VTNVTIDAKTRLISNGTKKCASGHFHCHSSFQNATDHLLYLQQMLIITATVISKLICNRGFVYIKATIAVN
jgi:hypothetical protein